MPTLLHIETATAVCSAAISRDGKRLAIGQETELLIYRLDPPASHD
jgi:hypothetical protein